MRANVVARPALIGAFWFGIQAVWSALLGVFLQSRLAELVPAHEAGTYGPVTASSAIAVYATISSGGAVIAAVVQVVAGFSSDHRLAKRGNRREFYLAGIALAVPALIVFFIAPNVLVLAMAFAGIQIGMNVASGPYQAAIPDAIDPSSMGRASAWMSSYSFFGSVVGLLIATVLHGYLAAIALTVILVFGAGITLAHIRRLPAIVARRLPLVVTRDMWVLFVSRGAINLGFYTLFGFLFYFVSETLAVPDARTTTGLLFIAFTVAGVAGAALAGRPTDRYDKRLVIGIAAVAIGVAVGCFAGAPNLPVAFGAAIASGIAWGAFFTADWALAYAVLPRDSMAAAMGVWNLTAVIPQILAPVITAPLVLTIDARHAGLGPRVALALVIVEFAIGALVLWRLPAAITSPARRS